MDHSTRLLVFNHFNLEQSTKCGCKLMIWVYNPWSILILAMYMNYKLKNPKETLICPNWTRNIFHLYVNWIRETLNVPKWNIWPVYSFLTILTSNYQSSAIVNSWYEFTTYDLSLYWKCTRIISLKTLMKP